MSTTLPEVLYADQMLGYVEKVKAGLPVMHLPPGLLTASPKRVEGNTFTYTTYSGTQKVIRAGAYGAPTRGRTKVGVGALPGVTITSGEQMEVNAAAMVALKNPENNAIQRLGESEVQRLLREATTLRMNARVAYLTSLLVLGAAYQDAEGNLLPSSSGAINTISAPTPTTYTKSASWQTATTDILGDLASFQAQSLRTTGLPIQHAIYGSRVLKSLMTNTDCRDLIIRNIAANGNVLNGAPQGMVFELGGITWWPGQFGFFEDNDGTDRQFQTGSAGTLDQDHIVFMPTPSSEWYDLIEGTTPVYGSSSDPDAAALWGGIETQQGMWQWADRQQNTVGMVIHYGDNWFPSIKVAGAVGHCDTV
ncbi:MAG: major capsid protein [Phycisphaerales bacterium]|nr:major capsid protein [Phycisphaerales bacterium]